MTSYTVAIPAMLAFDIEAASPEEALALAALVGDGVGGCVTAEDFPDLLAGCVSILGGPQVIDEFPAAGQVAR